MQRCYDLCVMQCALVTISEKSQAKKKTTNKKGNGAHHFLFISITLSDFVCSLEH